MIIFQLGGMYEFLWIYDFLLSDFMTYNNNSMLKEKHNFHDCYDLCELWRMIICCKRTPEFFTDILFQHLMLKIG